MLLFILYWIFVRTENWNKYLIKNSNIILVSLIVEELKNLQNN